MNKGLAVILERFMSVYIPSPNKVTRILQRTGLLCVLHSWLVLSKWAVDHMRCNHIFGTKIAVHCWIASNTPSAACSKSANYQTGTDEDKTSVFLRKTPPGTDQHFASHPCTNIESLVQLFVEQLLLVHLNLSLPLQQRHSSQLDVDVIDALVEEISSPLGNLIVNTEPFITWIQEIL